MKTSRIGLVITALALLLTGCTPCPTKSVGVEQLLGEYNANAAAIPKLWARATIDLTIIDDKGGAFNWGTTIGASNGLLITGKTGPATPDFVLVGRESGQEVMRLGTSSADNLYYAWYHFGDKGGAWSGRADRAAAAGATDIFVDPLTLVSLLGIIELPAGSVALRMERGGFAAGPCAYVLTCSQPGTNISKREIYFTWTQEGPRRVFQVICFGRDGQRVLTAKLSDYGSVSGADVHGQPAIVPTDITMAGNDSPGHKNHLRNLHLKLAGMKVGEVDPAEAAKFWDNLPPALKDRVVDIDKPLSDVPAELPTTAPTQERR
jgi:hypothetical protein